MRKLGVASVLLATLFTANAQAEVLSCDGCTSQQMWDKGSAKVLATAFRDPHPPVYVTNFHNNTVIKVMYGHNVNQNFDWENDIFEAWAINSSVEPSVTQLVSTIHSLMPGTVVYLPANSSGAMTARSAATQLQDYPYPTSAYEAVSNPSKDLQVHNYLVDSWAGFRQGMVSTLAAFNPIAGFNPNSVQVTAEVRFVDGSTALYAFDGATKLWTRIKGQSRDSHGNIVPETAADVAGGGVREYNFGSGGADLDNFLARMNQLGIVVDLGVGTGATVGSACTSVQGGGTICVLVFR